ncbi:uncharacterized protein H6S33_010863 [Morchella sextelata]|uniref:uncharacterized protein n=1 Tax=Morchella sextelata TaxID=1174677 RepID=UPI001D0437C7|nr:uncharacterized protein H6S33_010863 [Morchella sextelata]KAH0611598.1 hypothetical protein H6S33_010863 [Morchella sextelata]
MSSLMVPSMHAPQAIANTPIDRSNAAETDRMLYLLRRNTLYTNPYFSRVISWSLNPKIEPQPPVDYILALINQARERIEALSIDRELTICALKTVPNITCERIWEGINHGLNMLPNNDPEIDDMTATVVKVTDEIRGLKDLIWGVQKAVWEDPIMVQKYPVRPGVSVITYELQRTILRRAADEAAAFAATVSSLEMEEDDFECGLGIEVLEVTGPTSYDGDWVDEEMERDNEERKNAEGGIA